MFYPNISHVRTFIERRSLFLIVKAIVCLTGQDNKKKPVVFWIKKISFQSNVSILSFLLSFSRWFGNQDTSERARKFTWKSNLYSSRRNKIRFYDHLRAFYTNVKAQQSKSSPGVNLDLPETADKQTVIQILNELFSNRHVEKSFLHIRNVYLFLFQPTSEATVFLQFEFSRHTCMFYILISTVYPFKLFPLFSFSFLFKNVNVFF